MLIEIHMLQNHAPCNLNRDDTGSPKDCIFGGIRRSRISSQSIKRSIRCSPVFQEEMKGVELATRTRKLPELVKQKLLKDGIDEKMADIAAKKVVQFGKKESKDKDEKEDSDSIDVEVQEQASELKTPQIMFITQKDIDIISSAIEELIKKAGTANAFKKVLVKDIQKAAIDKGLRPITPDIALFGRMITSDAFRDVEASMQVAHAISTNKMDHEFDYFTAVDDLQENDEGAGAGMIGDLEFNSACYYKYSSLDYDALIDNLAGSKLGEKASEEEKKAYLESVDNAKKVARQTVISFIKAAIFTSPTGKQNTFAAHQLPNAILIEVRPKKTPISYANAFVDPAKPHGNIDLIQDSTQKFADYVETLTRKYGLESGKRLWFTTDNIGVKGTETCETINDLLAGLVKAL